MDHDQIQNNEQVNIDDFYDESSDSDVHMSDDSDVGEEELDLNNFEDRRLVSLDDVKRHHLIFELAKRNGSIGALCALVEAINGDGDRQDDLINCLKTLSQHAVKSSDLTKASYDSFLAVAEASQFIRRTDQEILQSLATKSKAQNPLCLFIGNFVRSLFTRNGKFMERDANEDIIKFFGHTASQLTAEHISYDYKSVMRVLGEYQARGRLTDARDQSWIDSFMKEFFQDLSSFVGYKPPAFPQADVFDIHPALTPFVMVLGETVFVKTTAHSSKVRYHTGFHETGVKDGADAFGSYMPPGPFDVTSRFFTRLTALLTSKNIPHPPVPRLNDLEDMSFFIVLTHINQMLTTARRYLGQAAVPAFNELLRDLNTSLKVDCEDALKRFPYVIVHGERKFTSSYSTFVRDCVAASEAVFGPFFGNVVTRWVSTPDPALRPVLKQMVQHTSYVSYLSFSILEKENDLNNLLKESVSKNLIDFKNPKKKISVDMRMQNRSMVQKCNSVFANTSNVRAGECSLSSQIAGDVGKDEHYAMAIIDVITTLIKRFLNKKGSLDDFTIVADLGIFNAIEVLIEDYLRTRSGDDMEAATQDLLREFLQKIDFICVQNANKVQRSPPVSAYFRTVEFKVKESFAIPPKSIIVAKQVGYENAHFNRLLFTEDPATQIFYLGTFQKVMPENKSRAILGAPKNLLGQVNMLNTHMNLMQVVSYPTPFFRISEFFFESNPVLQKQIDDRETFKFLLSAQHSVWEMLLYKAGFTPAMTPKTFFYNKKVYAKPSYADPGVEPTYNRLVQMIRNTIIVHVANANVRKQDVQIEAEFTYDQIFSGFYEVTPDVSTKPDVAEENNARANKKHKRNDGSAAPSQQDPDVNDQQGNSRMDVS